MCARARVCVCVFFRLCGPQVVLCSTYVCILLLSVEAIAVYADEFFSVGLKALEDGKGVEASYKFFMPNMVCRSCDRHVT